MAWRGERLRLLHLNAGAALATAVHIASSSAQHRAEGFRRADLDLGAESVEPRARLRRRGFAERGVQLVDDSGGVPAGATTPSQNGEFSFG